jgi:hypothetical protein
LRLLLISALALALAAPAGAAKPAIARPGLAGAGASAAAARGLVFFLEIEDAPGVAAVGTAHTYPIERITESGRVDFFLGGTLGHIGTSERFLVQPGRPFSLPDASIRGDFVVYAFDKAPKGVRALPAEPGEVAPGLRVRVLGVPTKKGRNEDDVYGSVEEVTAQRLEVALDIPTSLAGWGGAPVLAAESGKVVGFLQAALPGDTTTRLIAAPIGGVLEALKTPAEDGRGRSFAAFAGIDEDDSVLSRRRTSGELGRDANASKLLANDGDDTTQIHLDVEYPAAGSTVSEATCGVFVSGRAIAMRGDVRRFDVIMVIDTSRSTIDPTGTDINGNGKVGEPRLGRLGALFGSGSTDPGDSILAAEIAAARQLMRGLDPRTTRLGLVVFAGDPGGGGWSRKHARPAYTLEALTRDYTRVERSLDYLLASEPEGSTHMAAGVDQATVELLGLRGATSDPDPEAEKVVFFFTDGQPTLPYGPDAEADNVRAVLRAANRANRGSIRIHSFAIGPDALDGPIAPVEMASRTDGFFTPVRHPGDLVDVVEEVSFANIRNVTLWSDTTGQVADPFRVTADGTWGGLVKMQDGRNDLRVTAVSDDGTEIERSFSLDFVADAPASDLPTAYVARRNRLLEDCLRETKRLRLEAERARLDQVRRDLKVEIERERAKAQNKANEQRKRLQIEMNE